MLPSLPSRCAFRFLYACIISGEILSKVTEMFFLSSVHLARAPVFGVRKIPPPIADEGCIQFLSVYFRIRVDASKMGYPLFESIYRVDAEVDIFGGGRTDKE